MRIGDRVYHVTPGARRRHERAMTIQGPEDVATDAILDHLLEDHKVRGHDDSDYLRSLNYAGLHCGHDIEHEN